MVKILDRPVVMYQVDGAAHGGLASAADLRCPRQRREMPRSWILAPGGWPLRRGSPPWRAAGATTDTLCEARRPYLPHSFEGSRVFGVAGLVMEQGDDTSAPSSAICSVALLLTNAVKRRRLALASERKKPRRQGREGGVALESAACHFPRFANAAHEHLGRRRYVARLGDVLDEAQRKRLDVGYP